MPLPRAPPPSSPQAIKGSSSVLFLAPSPPSLQVAFRPYVSEVLPLVIEAIQDSSCSGKRLVAVKTLGQVRGLAGGEQW